jgi:hypothetical protein
MQIVAVLIGSRLSWWYVCTHAVSARAADVTRAVLDERESVGASAVASIFFCRSGGDVIFSFFNAYLSPIT